ncbi:PREDICTED: uncharacterized protein LOC109363553 [Lupinus angustifolius]|uniref:uncharacterized protein LOC109363553 n=1 Tax=Lupinus angustifolius TaxID=3871 RepID=UPI00092E3D62|nr:PREDICTED: uncharacterized protein LOC109363553 [Lupinus angustifolius]
MDAESVDSIIEVREDVMVSPSSVGNPTCTRTAYFIKPCIKQCSPCHILPPTHYMLSGTLNSSKYNHSKLALDVRYNGWRHPYEEWKTWVQLMESKYEYLWVKAGIHQAIKASTYQIHKNHDLILGLARRWCSKTNTLVFPWGEATITLEDIKVCGDYSILGEPFCTPLATEDEKETEAELVATRRMFFRSKARRANHKPWMMHFMANNGSQVEHEAFLSFWLSRFVFPSDSRNSILKSVFPIAIHLARGTRIALAPAILASIYRDLTLLNSNIIAIDKNNFRVTLWAPFQLVQVWAMERFQALQPQPHVIEQSQPRMARWHTVKMPKIENMDLTLDCDGDRNCFLWRPYENSPSLRLYNEKDLWECDNPCIESELLSFVFCLRVSELVGMGCREQYLPHRVAMQFGMDQDIPGMVEPSHTGSLVNYYIWDRNLCKALCPCQCQPNVTFRYYNWWKQSNIDSSRMDDSRIAKNEWNETRRKSSFVNEMQSREVASPCIAQEKVFNLENRILKLEREVAILKLEREVAKLKAARLAPKFENIGAKTKPCISSRPAIQKVYIRRNKHGFELNLEAKFENSGAKAHNNTESLNSKWVQTRSRSFKE